MNNLLILAVICSLLCTTTTAAADDTPNGFYKKNYAASPGSTTLPESAKDDAFTSPEPEIAPTSSPGLAAPGTLGTQGTPVTGEPIPVRAFGGVLNGLDLDLFKMQIEFFANMVTKTKGYVEPLYVLGRPEEVSPVVHALLEGVAEKAVYMEILTRMQIVSKLPATVAVTQAPSWLVTTDKGMYVLQGVAAPGRYFTQDGRFLVPEFLGSSGAKK